MVLILLLVVIMTVMVLLMIAKVILRYYSNTMEVNSLLVKFLKVLRLITSLMDLLMLRSHQQVLKYVLLHLIMLIKLLK
jgi:hypothetical protein